MPTTDDLQNQINALTLRVAVLDGQGLTPPLLGFIQQARAQIIGMRNDLDGSVLALEATLNRFITLVEALQVSVNTLLALNGIPLSACITPPTT